MTDEVEDPNVDGWAVVTVFNRDTGAAAVNVYGFPSKREATNAAARFRHNYRAEIRRGTMLVRARPVHVNLGLPDDGEAPGPA